MPYRYIYLGLGLVAFAAIALALAFGGGGEELVLPEQIEAISPEPGDLVPPQAALEIDLPVGYSAQIFVDDWQVPDAVFVEGTGVYRWAPSANSPVISEWTPGEHTVRVVWDTLDGLPDPGEFEWSFRVG